MKAMGIPRFAAVVAIASLILISLMSGGVDAYAANSGQSFIIAGYETSETTFSRHKRHATDSSITSLHVTSVIVSRFARVTFSSKMENDKDLAMEKVFSVRLPSAAFITEFNMIVGGVTFVGKVKEKEEAREQYEQAVERGNVAGLVAADVRETQTFDVSAHVPAHSSADFHLVYQQLLNRKLGKYEHSITVNTEQLINDLVIDIYITEKSGITSFSTEFPGEGSGERGKASRDSEVVEVNTEIRRSKNQAKISFKPTGTEIRRFLKLPKEQQKFTVRYDVTREVLGGEIQTRNGYFVHFFAPEDLPVLPKRVVFVIDRSGSMDGRKIHQTKTAFASVIKELRKTDQFNIVTFSSDVTAWRTGESGVVAVTEQNVREAIDYVKEIDAGGWTNLNEAIQSAADLLEDISTKNLASSMIVLLTDGMPTAGVTDTAQIRLNAKTKIDGQFSLFCLGFGDDVDQDFLKRLANENDGISRKIYEDSDADLQLKGFFQEVATPLLLNVRMTYTGANLTELSRSRFDKFFKGSETTVVGKYDPEQTGTIRSVIQGRSEEGDVVYNITSIEIDDTFQHWYKDTGELDDFMERLWAYFTVRDLLEKRTLAENRLEMQKLTDGILHLALKYKFVTSLTSMVVTLPEDELTTTTVRPFEPTFIPPIQPCYRPAILCPVLLNGASDGNSNPGRSSSRGRAASLGGRRASSRGMATRGRRASRPTSIPRTMVTQPPLGRPARGGRSMRGRGTRSRRPPITSATRGRRSPRTRGTRPPRTQATHPPTTRWTTTLPSMTRPPRGRGRGGPPHGRGRGRRTRFTTIKTPPPPTSWGRCSGTLRESSGSIQLPDAPGPRAVFSCGWRISLPEGKWVDLFIGAANTTKNEIVIKNKGKTIYQHFGGDAPAEYISLENNGAEIIFTVYQDDVQRPGILISYKQFTPEDRVDTDTTTVTGRHLFHFSMANCGKNISSSESERGEIKSPGYPKSYPENAFCLWDLINDVEDQNLVLTFLDIDIESAGGSCPNDKVVVVVGDEDRVFCGFQRPDRIVIKEKLVKIAFISDDALGANGFRLRYEFIEAE